MYMLMLLNQSTVKRKPLVIPYVKEIMFLPKLSQFLPSERVAYSVWPHIRGLELADPDFAEPQKIDCILGTDAYLAVILSGLTRGPKNTPVAQNSAFGWLLTGPTLSHSCSCHTAQVRAFHVHTEPPISENLQKFWEIEKVPRKSLLTEDEIYCEKLFVQTYSRNKEGRFVVRLPLRSNPEFISSRDIAVACLLRSEKRLRSNPDLAESFVFTTDVVQMFRQILVHANDMDWQRVLWRSSTDQPIRNYKCVTVTYGTSSAPYLALKVIQQLAVDATESHPHASEILRHKLYVDDLFAGADTIEAAQECQDQRIQLLASAGMLLSKWATNDSRVLQGLASVSAKEISLKLDEVISTLGLKWLPNLDVFTFTTKPVSGNGEDTKRSILSVIARLFNPLGWLAPTMVIAKIILQDLWLNNLNFDSPVPEAINHRWASFRNELREVSLIRIPRWLGGREKDEWHLHGFADGSKRAYAAALYAVTPGQAVHLLFAKTKLAPTRVQTLPRLELCGCTLLARLVQHLLENIPTKPISINCWTDSIVVLEWLKSHPSRWPTFVANRTSEILTGLPAAVWRHVRSEDNPADCATRGLTPAALAKYDIWWRGPKWLIQKESIWPSLTSPQMPDQVKLQASAIQRKPPENLKQAVNPECLPSLQKFSCFAKIIRIIAYCCRWRLRTVHKQLMLSDVPLAGEEQKLARTYCFRAIQLQHYQTERQNLADGQTASKRSPFSRLSPFLDDLGLIRVGGRLYHSSLPYSEMHPIILPGNCQFVRQLVEEAHRLTLHGGVQLMLSHLRRSVWIIRGPRVAAGVLHRCTVCTRFAAKSSAQQMGQLPAARVTPARPFAHTGVDYAGPTWILFLRGRGAKSTKGYLAIFVCMVTRAVYIEVVSDLTTDLFIAAYARFCARRGVCDVLYSDNATNSKGAASELQRMFSRSSNFTASLIERLWEAAVRSVKYHLTRVIGETRLTFEELSTLCANIEACLNFRPLCTLSNEVSAELTLTPSHFLVGSALLSHPESYDELQQPIRWRKEVLYQHLKRNKWLKPQPNIAKGDVVIIKDELSPPAKWPLGLVTATHPGADGLVRVATIKTADTKFDRPIVKLIKLLDEPELNECFKDEVN
ncbi:uncharacterized protein LOC106645583 [Copidosoma floridanum]|uniref:uncharacterized protein LOC106645583 n=1 Tax=Copidosoma floridanum TaxID=29053 RepID=UPI0006C95B55|nr:uncharacterized protein LOC106645583 [Copidosoma floridanum]